MIKITFVLPNIEMREMAKITFEEHNKASLEQGDETEYRGEFMASLQPELFKRFLQKSDAVVARGLTALNIRRMLPDTPISEIPVSGRDIISAVQEVLRADKTDKKMTIAVISSTSMVYSAKNLGKSLGAELKEYIIQSSDPKIVQTEVDCAIEDGCDAVIGGIDICECAQRRGCPSAAVPISRESVWQAITEAKHNAQIRNTERINGLQYYNVLQNIKDAIIATEVNGKILVFNPAAEQLLHVTEKDAIGKNAVEFLRGTPLEELLENEKDYTNYFVKQDKLELIVNKRRLYMDERNYVGTIFTFQRTEELQRAEFELRRKLQGRGLVARHSFSDIIGQSDAIKQCISMARIFASVHSNLLIHGETGTGKELFAQSIHNASPQKNGPFVAVNCAALTPSLIESELFGYAPGTFTGALKSGKAGVFENAHQGTLFLDEISEIPLDIQGRLLRVIQEREVVRVGDDTVRAIDVRLICASNRSLLQMVEDGMFREDLYFRLNVLPLELPPLRDRQEDVVLIFEHYLRRYLDSGYRMTRDAIEYLKSLPWKGNVREIRNICERIAILDVHKTIRKEDVVRAVELGSCRKKAIQIHEKDKTPSEKRISVKKENDMEEREKLLDLLDKYHYNRTLVARELKIGRTTLWRRMKDLGLDEGPG